VASRIGIHLRFGTISIRAVARVFQSLDETLFTQLIWREFFFGILYRDPSLSQKAYAPWGNHLEWENDPKKFEAWKSGHTGFPLVDAGMRQLAQTGEIHNRVRMVVASFLVKNALIDWRWGERHFAQTLLDYDMALNNGNWQWCAGTGVDAAPYFRVFNPESQRKKFDPDGRYCRQWVKEWGTVQYPQPILDLALTRQRAIETFRRAREGHPQAITADAQPCPF
jgi:deoxyribodipyrimidine photo-lyase